jgi:formate transporter
MRQTAAFLTLLCSMISVSQAFAGPQTPVALRTNSNSPLRVGPLPMVPSGGSTSPPSSPTIAMTLKSPPALYEGAVAAGAAKAAAPASKIFKLGVVAGCHIAFGAYLALSVGGACPGIAAENPGLQKLIFGAIGLPTGLIMTLVTGAELFTGNTALVTGAYMEGKITKQQLFKNWICSYAGNFVGSLLLAWLAYKAGTLGTGPAAVNIAVAKCAAPWDVTFYRGVLCNWLVCMAVYMASGCSTMIGKMSEWFVRVLGL